MPKEMLNISSFKGGLNRALDARDIELDELSGARNVVFDTNGIIKPAGRCSESLTVVKDFPFNDILSDDLRPGKNFYYFESSVPLGETVEANPSTTFAATSDYFLSEKFSHTIWDDDDNPIVDLEPNTWYALATDYISPPGVNLYKPPIINEEVPYTQNWHTNIIKPYDYDGDGKHLHAVFHYTNDALRVNNSFNNFANRSKWFGFIKKQNFFASAATTTDYHFNGWYELDNDIKKPTELDYVQGSSSNDGTSGNGTGFEVKINATTGGTIDFTEDMNNDNTELILDLGATFIYDGIQESLLYEIGDKTIDDSGNNATSAANDNALEITVGVKTGFNPRITGGRIYYKKAGSNDDYVLLCDIDFSQGIRASLDNSHLDSTWTVISGSGTNVPIKSNTVLLTTKNLDTYSSLTEWGEREQRISIGCTGDSNGDGRYPKIDNLGYGETYQASTVTNGRCFIANTRLYKSEGMTDAIPDAGFRGYDVEENRIYYSGMCSKSGVTFESAYDCFPRGNYIDIESNDSSGFKALYGFADRLFAFKETALYILNISGKTTEEWFLESEHFGLGIDNQAQFTQFDEGAVWANKTGVYVYTSNSATNKSSEDVSFQVDIQNIWNSKLDNPSDVLINPLVGYSRHDKSIIVHSDSSNSNSLTFIYNFKTNTWTECNNIVRKVDFSSNVPISNFIYGNKGILQFAQEADTDVGLKRQLVQNYWLPHNDFLSDGDHGYDNGTSALTVTNGDFSSASGWTASGATQNTTAGTVTFDDNSEYIQRTDFAAAGDIIEITFTIDSVTGGSLRVTDGTSIKVFHASTVPGTYTHYYTATNQTLRFQVHNLHDGQSIVLSNVTAKKILGMDGWPSSGSNSTELLATKLNNEGSSTGSLQLKFYTGYQGSTEELVTKHAHYGPVAISSNDYIKANGYVFSDMVNTEGREVNLSLVSATDDDASAQILTTTISNGNHGIGGWDEFSVGELFTGASGNYFIRFTVKGYNHSSHKLNEKSNYIALGGEDGDGITAQPRTEVPDVVVRFFGIDANNNKLDLYNDINYSIGEQYIVTKDIDFGQPGRKKRIYNLLCTYSTDSAHTTPVSYAVDGSDNFVDMNGDFDDTERKWKAGRFSPSSTFTCQSIKFKIKNTTDSQAFKINDLSVEYRTSSRKVA